MEVTLLRNLLLICGVYALNVAHGQILTSEGGQIHVAQGGILHCNGGMVLNDDSQLTNEGLVTITKNSALPESGNLRIQGNTTASGNGNYRVEQDWINNAIFIAQNSTVFLYGDTEQFITSENGTVTTFNNLTLSGTGTGQNRKKTLVDVNAATGQNGILQLANRELNTEDNQFLVLNPNPIAVQHDNTFNAEGFVSSVGNGYLIRRTNSANTYLFPVGSSNGTLRYRPVELDPNTASTADFAVRFNNITPDNDGYPLNQKEAEVETANNLFYHSIERLSGNALADFRIHYLPNIDGEWAGIANWSNPQTQWKNTGETEPDQTGNFSFQQKSGWDFGTANHPYVLITTGFELVIPNVFTPNGDGSNDIYFITTKGLTEFNLIIVNRWGNVMFETNDPNEGWDGTSNGQKCAEGTYFYLLNAKAGNKEFKEHGFLTLIGSN